MNKWTAAVFLYALFAVAGLAYVLLDLPIQVTDGYTNMVTLRRRPFFEALQNEFYQTSYLRPLLWAQHRLLFDAARGHYFEVFRGWHVLQVLVLVTTFVHLLRPRTANDAAAVPLGLAVLFGIHTFAGTVREAFPVNTFMTVLLCCVGAAVLALGEPRWWRNVAAGVLFVFAALTVESGLLVWVVIAAAFAGGARGVTRGGIIALSTLLAGYFVLRVGVLEISGPGLIERSSGYGFAVLSPEELTERFGSNPLRFYIYNVLSSLLSVLLSEPRAGVWRLALAWRNGEVPPHMYLNLLASGLGTALVVWFVWIRRRAWMRWELETGDRLVFMAAAVLCANAVVSYPYTKDVIMSPAGVFYALAVSVAARGLLGAAATRRAAMALTLVLLAASTTWAVRAAAVHIGIRESATVVRNEWAYIDQWLAREGQTVTEPAALRLQQELQDDAIARHPAAPVITGEWLEWLDLE